MAAIPLRELGTEMAGIVCFGEALIDFIGEPPQPGRTRAFLQHAGGAPANVAVAVARLGGIARFVGMFSTDPFGDFLLDSLRGCNVDVRHARRTPAAPTALAFVALDALGERSFNFYRPPAADLLFRDADFDAALFDEAAVFHTCSNSLTEAAIAQATLSGMRRARAAQVLVSFDMNLRPGLWAPGADPAPPILAALALADVVKLSVEELAFVADHDGGTANALARLWRGPAQLVVVTDGRRGVDWHTRSGHGHLDSFDVDAVDTTAAGDAFVGGLLVGLSEAGATPSTCRDALAHPPMLAAALRLASACGALATTRQGAFVAMPLRADVEALLAQADASPHRIGNVP